MTVPSLALAPAPTAITFPEWRTCKYDQNIHYHVIVLNVSYQQTIKYPTLWNQATTVRHIACYIERRIYMYMSLDIAYQANICYLLSRLMSTLFYAKNDTLQLHVTCEQKSHHFFMYWIHLNYWQTIEPPIPQKLWSAQDITSNKRCTFEAKNDAYCFCQVYRCPKEYTLIELFTPHDIVFVWWPRKHHRHHWYSCWPNPPPHSTAAWDGRAAISMS